MRGLLGGASAAAATLIENAGIEAQAGVSAARSGSSSES